MITHRDFFSQIPNTEDTIFRLIGSPRGGVLINIENHDENNEITYKFQESNDGSTWVDKVFRTVDNDTAISFIIPSSNAHAIKVSMGSQMLRLRASGDCTASISVNYSLLHNPSTAVELIA